MDTLGKVSECGKLGIYFLPNLKSLSKYLQEKYVYTSVSATSYKIVSLKKDEPSSPVTMALFDFLSLVILSLNTVILFLHLEIILSQNQEKM